MMAQSFKEFFITFAARVFMTCCEHGATINNSDGGAASDYGFMVSASANTVLGFSLSGATIPADENILLYLDLNGTPTGLSSLVFSDASGNVIDCATLAGDGSCDEECNTGACNKDGGDCE